MTKNNKVIAIDVDLTLAASDRKWFKYLEKVTGRKVTPNPWDLLAASYNLTDYFKEELAYNGMTGYEFWDQPDLYDEHVYPVEGSVEGCEALKAMGYTLVPVSVEMGLHGQSKRRWLKKYFPMLEPAILVEEGTEKFRIKCDYIIEDRMEYLKGFTSETEAIILDTPYRKYAYGIGCYISLAIGWESIVEYFEYINKEDK